MTSRRRGVLLAVAIIAACDRQPPGPAATPTPVPRPPDVAAASGNLAMGTGEFRKPEPFTPEQRLLDAVRRNDRPAAERVLARRISVNAKDDIGRNTLFLAVLDAQSLDLARWLHEKGAAIDDPDTGGRTALSFAAANGHLDIVRYLVDQGAVVDRRDVQKRTALFHAALNDRRDVAAFLIERGADVNVADQWGDTPLIVACAKGQGDMATLLLAKGADAGMRDQEGRTATQRAANGTDACLKLDTK